MMKEDYSNRLLLKYVELSMKSCIMFIFAITLTLSLCCASFSSLHADVFLFGGGGGKAWGSDLLGGTKLWSEPALINGVRSSVQLVLLKKQIDECYQILKHQFKDARFRFNKESILAEIKRENGNIERIYLVNMGEGEYPVLQFSMEVPAELPRNPRWPDDLPSLYDSEPVNVINLTDRGTLYASFRSSSTSEQILNQLDSSMLADGWSSTGRGTYLKDNPTRIVLISATEDEHGITHGFVLKRKLLSK